MAEYVEQSIARQMVKTLRRASDELHAIRKRARRLEIENTLTVKLALDVEHVLDDTIEIIARSSLEEH